MYKVLVSRNYAFPDLERMSPGQKGVWKNVQITEDHSKDVDFILVLNQPAEDIKRKAYEGGAWLFLQEPPYDTNDYFRYHFRFVDSVISGFRSELEKNIQSQAGLPWHVGRTYDELVNLKVEEIQKRNRISWITSSNNMFPGHQPRIDFIDHLKSVDFDFDLYGRGFEPIEDKFDGIAPYKYSIAVENYVAKDYWTEKAIDCLLSWTIPIYFGCTNMEDYFPKGSFIEIDITDKESAVKQLEEVLASNHWEDNISEVAKARELILNKYQLFPLLEDKIDTFFKENPAAKKKNYFIPKDGLTRTESLKKTIRKIIGK